MRPSTALGLLVIAIVAVVVLLYAPGTGIRAHDLCAQPVSVQGRIVSCNGAMPSADPSPGAAR